MISSQVSTDSLSSSTHGLSSSWRWVLREPHSTQSMVFLGSQLSNEPQLTSLLKDSKGMQLMIVHYLSHLKLNYVLGTV